jgi:hypothetical protein
MSLISKNLQGNEGDKFIGIEKIKSASWNNHIILIFQEKSMAGTTLSKKFHMERAKQSW